MTGLAATANSQWIWGLDIGVGSIGWAVTRQGNERATLVDCGVRIFPAAVEGDYASGKDKSPNLARQLARSMRRQRYRRSRRLGALARLLQAHCLLPPGHLDSPSERDSYFKTLDEKLRPPSTAPTVEQHTWLYRLFARGVAGEPLAPYALGRLLYHAAQLRGFKSNAKERAKATLDEQSGKVYDGIKSTHALMAKFGATHVTESFAHLDPETPGQRIRARHTSRRDREAGVDALLKAQVLHYADKPDNEKLSPETIKAIFDAIFFQRPATQDTSALIGRCGLFPDERRAIMALPSLQKLRVLQKVNDLEVTAPGEVTHALTSEQRCKVRNHLLSGNDLTFTQLRALLEFPVKPRKSSDGTQPPFHEFNLERGDPKERLRGDCTQRHLAPILGDVWNSMSLDQRDAVVEEIFAHDDDDDAKSALCSRFDFSPELAEKVMEGSGRLETDRGRYCATAARALCQVLDTGDGQPVRLSTAIKQLRANRPSGPAVVERVWNSLPPLIPTHNGVPAFFENPTALRNPVILRTLGELRIVVNALLRKYGKPDRIRIELARDLKKPRSEREEIAKIQKERAVDREDARKALVGLGIRRPSDADVEKWLLGKECGWHCPYTGDPLPPLERVFARDSDVHVEHIIPRHRSLDNSFANKTLATASANAEKNDRSPHAAFSANPQRWHEILIRVAAFTGPAARGKLARFQWTEEEIARRYDDFTDRHLRDTAYAARLAKDYLSTLFGAVESDAIDATGTRRVETVAGRVTSLLGHAWGLYRVLLAKSDLPTLPPPEPDHPRPGASEKFRADHRHHAIDAIVVAFTTPGAIQLLSAAIQAGRNACKFAVEPPASDLVAHTAKALDQMVVSHRASRRVNGALHQATYYQPPRSDGRRFQRKALEDFKNAADFARIVDQRIRDAVISAWEKRPESTKDPSIFFKTPENLPRLSITERRNGTRREIAIRTVTIPIDDLTTVMLGPPDVPSRQLHAKTGDNFCVAIIETPPRRQSGKKALRFHPITRLDAARRIVHRTDPERPDKPRPLKPKDMIDLAPDEQVLYTIRSSEVLRLNAGKHTGLFLVGTASNGLEVTRLNDARTDNMRKGDKKRGIPSDRIRLSPSGLLEAKAEKVVLGPLGEVTVAHD